MEETAEDRSEAACLKSRGMMINTLSSGNFCEQALVFRNVSTEFLDSQTLQGVRELTEESEVLLDSFVSE